MAINHIVIHCSATTNGKPLRTSSQSAAERIDQWHQKRGFKRNPAHIKRFASLLIQDVMKNTATVALLNHSIKEMVETVSNEKIARGKMKYVGVIHDEVIDKLTAMDKAPQTAVIAVRDDDILHALRDSKQEKGISLTVEFWQQLPEKLRYPKAILLDGQHKQPTLLFVYETEQGKVAVKMDYEIKLKDVLTNKLPHKLNMIRTASAIKSDVEWRDFKKSYALLWGELD